MGSIQIYLKALCTFFSPFYNIIFLSFRKKDNEIDEEQPVKVFVDSINSKVKTAFPSLVSCQHSCIYRVHEKFHQMRPRAYSPEIVSIGPFHHQRRHKGNLQAMEECKLLYMYGLLSRTAKAKLQEGVENAEVVVPIDNGFGGAIRRRAEAALSARRGNPDPKSTEWLNILGECGASIRKIEKKARRCYSETIDVSSDEFIEMMLIDGLFIIELFRRGAGEVIKGRHDPLFGKIGSLSSLTGDLLLLENQLPMIVLDCLFKVPALEKEYLEDSSLNMLILNFFNHLMPRDATVLDTFSNKQAKHLLDLLAKTFYPSGQSSGGPEGVQVETDGTRVQVEPQGTAVQIEPEIVQVEPEIVQVEPEGTIVQVELEGVQVQPEGTGVQVEPVLRARLRKGAAFEGILRIYSIIKQRVFSSSGRPLDQSIDQRNDSWRSVPSVTELRRSGIKFAKKRSTTASFLDIEFKDGVLEIPPVIIQDKTDLLFRNLIASEQCSDGQVTFMTSYAFFMNSLIDTAQDVELLRIEGIITNNLGSDEEVADLFNTLCREVIIDNFYYSVQCDQLNEYYMTPWYKWRAVLMREYFHTPWAIISFSAAFLLIFLTLTATLLAFLSFFIHKS